MTTELSMARRGFNLNTEYGTKGPVDAQIVAETHGIKVLFVDFEQPVSSKVGSFYDPSERAIYINKALGGHQMNYAIAYELGMALIYKGRPDSDHGRVSPHTNHMGNENEPFWNSVDSFARHLLISKKLMERYAEIASTSHLAKIFAVPGSVLLRHKNDRTIVH